MTLGEHVVNILMICGNKFILFIVTTLIDSINLDEYVQKANMDYFDVGTILAEE